MDGILIINKEKGYTSHDVVGRLRKILKTKQIGHTGTLDPNATGVLPVLVGKATKTSKYLVEHNKTYIATMKLGEKRDTADIEGNIIETRYVSCKIFEPEKIKKVLNTFIGKQKQIPPIYSSIKVNGKKLYEYARNGEKVDIQPRNIEIYKIELLETNFDMKQIVFKVECSKGTYIRSLCEDIATKLGNIAYMSELQRIQVDKFSIQDSMTIEQVEQNKEEIIKKIIPIDKIFDEKEKIVLSSKGIELFLNGVRLTYILKDDLYKVYNAQGEFIGIGKVENNLLKRDIIL